MLSAVGWNDVMIAKDEMIQQNDEDDKDDARMKRLAIGLKTKCIQFH